LSYFDEEIDNNINDYSDLAADYCPNELNYELDIFFKRNSANFLVEKWIFKSQLQKE